MNLYRGFLVVALCTFGMFLLQSQSVYQFPNPDFEQWNRVSGDGGDVPTYWHTFSVMQCDLPWYAAIGCPVAKNNHSNRIAGYSGYGLQLYVKKIAGVLANGAMTTGRTRVKDMDPGNRENYNYDPEGYRWTFHGRPDSISFYAKSGGGMKGNAYFKVFLHDGNTFYDRANDDLTGTYYGCMILSFHPFSYWHRFVKAVSYNSSQTPQLLLGSFSTNRRAGEGSAEDKLNIDRLRCIYSKKLSDLRFDGARQDSLLAVLNAAEFLTHDGLTEGGSNSGTVMLSYPIAASRIANGAFPKVQASAESQGVLSCTVTQASLAAPYATIEVVHNDYSSFLYTIQFVNSGQEQQVYNRETSQLTPHSSHFTDNTITRIQ